MSQVTRRKRRDLAMFIEQVVLPEPAVQGVIGVGSVATGRARPDSDIDAVVFLEPFDLYAIPAEFKWQPVQGTFHPIFEHVEGAIQLDLKRFDLAQWSLPGYRWPEQICAELSTGWVAFDRNGTIERLVVERTKFTDEIHRSRLDEAFVQLDQLLDVEKAQQAWATLGPAMAHERLHAAYGYLMQALFAYNRSWRPWRSRELASALNLSWLPADLEAQIVVAVGAPSPAQDGYQQRLRVLGRLFDQIVARCQADGLYGARAVNEAFIRLHDEPGRAWNMDEWIRLHRRRAAGMTATTATSE